VLTNIRTADHWLSSKRIWWYFSKHDKQK